jgi:para-aminobenzoate synthetase/4-amino-4-deoxychorismate lyase
MKGTARRGRFTAEDQARYQQLSISAKDNAENVMIVDMVRNDLSRVAERGSVVTALSAEIERYPRVFQMTRKVSATVNCSLVEIMEALFPAASITGAPKQRTMELIADLESTPRRIYTGAVGFISPDGREVFNVAIRTALIDRERGSIEYGVGSGIVWDSVWHDEYDECIAKSAAITVSAACFDLFETILWEQDVGYFLLERHLKRLFDSAELFGWSINRKEAEDSLDALEPKLQKLNSSQRVRLIVSNAGKIRCEYTALEELPELYRVSLARDPVSSDDRTLFHKTTQRSVYELALPEVKGVHDVLLWNERGEITESRIANIVLELGGVLYTPPVTSGLLGGCYRAELLESGVIEERVLTKSDLKRAAAVYLINSLRKMWRVELMG